MVYINNGYLHKQIECYKMNIISIHILETWKGITTLLICC